MRYLSFVRVGNKRVREEGRKNVHAFVNGIIQPISKQLRVVLPQHEGAL